jgi:hypothetical protein
MSLEKINLRKLLQFFVADARKQRSLLLADIRNERAKETRDSNDGGDFYTPFWSDVKDHAARRSDIVEQTKVRISKNKARARLYPLLRDSFSEMWNEKMRWRNEPYEFAPQSIKAQLQLRELRALIKIENTASMITWDGSNRIIYPYFYETPPLTEQGARLGFWVLKEALPNHDINDFRIIDFIRRNYVRPIDISMRGDEGAVFIEKYRELLRQWRRLKRERA